MKKNIIIAASGTGGHIYPGIALARELKDRDYTPVFFISNNETSTEIIKNSGFDYITFNFSGLPRKISFTIISFFIKLVFSIFRAMKFILKYKPVSVVGMGGYISVPTIIAAKVFCKKTFIHEQNTIPGVANKFLNRIVGKTLISFDTSKKHFKNKKNIIFTGYPVRKDILNSDKDKAYEILGLNKEKFTVLIFGGSLGAVKLNEISFEAMQALLSKNDMQIVHIAGKKGYESIKKNAYGIKQYKVFDYMHNISDAYSVADIVVCRAGAGTLFELQLLNKPAILVPYPYATDNHQYYNAKEALQGGNMVLIEEKDLSPEKLAQDIDNLKNKIQLFPQRTHSLFPQEIMAEEIIKA